ncbi:Protein of unknown function [Cupriavidus sp. YR651]|uniref:DUF3318 domain-containing protein n=1 Tax=Cupriavidus sp. YR651 TaxID=1855315 RepID=UPI00088DB31E|nr:DUF3318 domain-containing protein [Cupriavidus sp. YR651]SDC19263.1 Protein of unknown function [Cupriavidus sp. YR651]
MTTPEDDNIDNRPRRDHPRPVRFTREVRLPLAVRKELLITRAALERYDAIQALRQVRGGARRMTNLGSWLPRLARPSGWLKLLGVTREYPMLSTAITLAMPLLRRTAIGRAAWKVSKYGMVAGAGYWAYKTWNESRRAGATTAPSASAPLDTGFRDPLVSSATPPAPPQP